ncbi:MAG: Tim44/TimA family putative adaptor protein [Rhodospirillales bacterium]
MEFLDIILFAVIAGFIVLRLRSHLGRRTGHQEPVDPFAQQRREQAEQEEERVLQFPDRSGDAEPEPEEERVPDIRRDDVPSHHTPVAKGVADIKSADSSFDDKEFVSGARMAFEMIVNSYANGDLKTLRPLLANEVFEEFAGAIRGREEAGEILETTLVGITDAELVEAELQGKTAFVTIRFQSEQINILRDGKGAIIEGGDKRVDEIIDLWTFARNTRSRDPNWTLVATDSPDEE